MPSFQPFGVTLNIFQRPQNPASSIAYIVLICQVYKPRPYTYN